MGNTVGLLLVHGIGKQAPGSTLADMGDPFLGWLRTWSRGHGGDFDLSTISDDPTTPRHIEGTWSCENDEAKVVVAECWWAESFAPPPLTQVLAWMPGMMYRVIWRWTHFTWGLLLLFLALLSFFLPGEWWWIAAVTLGLAVALVLAVPLLILIAYVLLQLLPWGRRSTLKFADWLTTAAGDALVLRSSETKFSAMRSRCLSDLQWIAEKCDRVIVIAHSQGSVIAVETLAATTDPRCDFLVTVGSALRLLQLPGRDPVARLRARRPETRWINIYSQLDPVSAGQISNSNYPIELIAQNSGSPLSAHTTYFKNTEGFLSVLLAVVADAARSNGNEDETAGSPVNRVFTEAEEQEFALAVELRELRSAMRMVCRWLSLAATPGITLLLQEGQWPALVSDFLAVAWFIPGWLRDYLSGVLNQQLGETFSAAVCGLTLAVVYQAIFTGGVFRWWDRLAARGLAVGTPAAGTRLASGVLSAALAPLAIAAIYGVIASGSDAPWAILSAVVAGLYPLAVVALVTSLQRESALRGHTESEDESEYEAFLFGEFRPVFPAFRTKLSNLPEVLNRERKRPERETILALEAKLAASVSGVRADSGGIKLSDDAVAALIPVRFLPRRNANKSFFLHQNDEDNAPYFTIDLHLRSADVFVFMEARLDAPDGTADPQTYNYYLLRRTEVASVGEAAPGSFLSRDVTRASLVDVGAGPLRWEDLQRRLGDAATVTEGGLPGE
ncbi:hypothetical protein [Cryobacterium glucosi]|uniref:Alpha/beta hydrolase n=1 Tax=Cryobacterium glucosi TaxID=1259175 RepID=A0ABY2IPL4_9MICO|nr:hypothetical protein [Cryobacterium glucosi]TFC21866.1 hypothetical protein E3O46_06605 [Cryobacterium glucosi]